MKKEQEPIKKPAKGRRYYKYESTVAFFDVVGFSKRATSIGMTGIFVDIQQIVADTFWEDFYWGETNTDNNLILLPTGDGYGICFPRSVEHTSVLGYIRQLWTQFKELNAKVRFGVNYGINYVVEDVNEMPNIIGWGITMAQRAMDIGDSGHILCTAEFARPLEKDIPQLVKVPWNFPIKHGDTLTIYNYFEKDKFGNPRMPRKQSKK